MALTPIGILHMAAASLGLVTGAVQLGRRPRDLVHRRVGYVYAGTMGISNLTALSIYRFTETFNVFHALALYNLFCIFMALRPMLARPRPLLWRVRHFMWIAWSYAGLCAAAVTEFLVRVVMLPGWLGAAVGTPPVILAGWWLITRYAPRVRQAAPDLHAAHR